MRNNEALYFDIWRKKDYRSLIKAYIKVAEDYPTKTAMRENFGIILDRYLPGGKGTYNGSVKQWHSAYTLGRELGVFHQENDQSGYEISPLASSVLHSRITPEQYLLIYLLNFNQMINGQIVHPLKEILISLNSNHNQITKNNILNIANFNLQVKSVANQNQIINILLHRLVESEILVRINTTTYQLNKYSSQQLLENLKEFNGTIQDFEQMTHSEFVTMISSPNALVPHYH